MKFPTRCLMTIALVSTAFIRCSEDEIPKIGFTSNSSDVIEGHAVSVLLSVPIPSDVTPNISFTGTATENLDFIWGVSTDGKELVFETLNDDVFDDETIIIEITGFNGSAALGSTVTHTIGVSDPGLLVELTWIKRDGGSADLDLILLRETTLGSGNYTEIAGSFGVGTSESLLLRGDNSNARYAIAVEYFDGSSDDIDFTITLSTTAGTINTNANEIAFYGSLTQYHKSAEQSSITLIKNDFNYSGFSNLFVATPLDIALSWDAGDGTAGDVDVDLYLLYFNPSSGMYEHVGSSTSLYDPIETVTLSGDAPDGTYGVRYKYYSGSSNTLSLKSTFTLTEGGNFAGTSNNVVAYNAVYTLANVNSDASSNISQTFVKSGTSFTNFSAITVPGSGSRAQPEDTSFAVTKGERKTAQVISRPKEKRINDVTRKLR